MLQSMALRQNVRASPIRGIAGEILIGDAFL
jgi:hypothetical protein